MLIITATGTADAPDQAFSFSIDTLCKPAWDEIVGTLTCRFAYREYFNPFVAMPA